MYIGFHVKYPLFLSGFNETWISWANFRKIFKYQISWKSVQCESSCYTRTDRQTDRAKLIDAFRNFAKAPKNTSLLRSEFMVRRNTKMRCVPAQRAECTIQGTVHLWTIKLCQKGFGLIICYIWASSVSYLSHTRSIPYHTQLIRTSIYQNRTFDKKC